MARDATTLPTTEAAHVPVAPGPAAAAWRRLRANRPALLSAFMLAVIAAVAVLGSTTDAVRRHDPTVQSYTDAAGADNTDRPPNRENWLGTDGLGRDMWARTLQATLFSLRIGVGAEVVVVAVGISLGMIAGLGGQRTDRLVVWITDLAYAFPDILMIILVRQVLIGRDWPILGGGHPQIPGVPSALLVTVIAISVVSWVTVCRLVRGQILSLREQEYVTAARSAGAGPWRVVRVHMLPNTLSTVTVAITFGIPRNIFAEASLAFIGLGVPPPFASLGSLMSDGRAHLQTNSLLVIWPALVVALLMLCFTFLSDGIRDALDPRSSS
ncbi:MAG: ABC transporter permease [Dehalococcoidia bacterium]|nr:MAG: ABC transporter permease [Dehalococcoidia bacterium]